MDVELYVDPTCAWSWTAFQWLDEVAQSRQLRIRLRPYSLVLRNGVDGLPEPLRSARLAGHRSLRILAALDDAARCAYFHALVAPFYAARTRPTLDITSALAAIGEPAYAAAAEDERWDDAIRESMAAARDVVGTDADCEPTIPVVAFEAADRTIAFQGPLLDPAPTRRDGLVLWDMIETMGRVPGLFELSRPHGRHSLVRALAQRAG